MSRRPKKSSGVYTVVVGLMLVVLMGFVGLAIDVGRHLVVQQELQNAADACALAAVREMDGTKDGLARASAAGMYVGGTRNLVDFQRTPLKTGSTNNLSVEFSVSVASDFWPANASQAAKDSRFVKCVAAQNQRSNFFMRILGFATSDVAAQAIATMQPAMVTCSAPIAISAKDKNDVDYGYKPYETFVLKPTNKGETPPPNTFSLANVNPNASNISGSFQMFEVCQVKTKSDDCIEMNPDASQVDVWNSRFGIYGGNLKPPTQDPTVTLPDRTGVVLTAPVSQATITQYQLAVTQKTIFQGYKNIRASTAAIHEYGKANARIIVFPIVRQKSDGGCMPGNLLGWGCGLMMNPYANGNGVQAPYDNARLMYLGRVNDKSSPAYSLCGTSGIPGNFTSNGPLVPSLVQ